MYRQHRLQCRHAGCSKEFSAGSYKNRIAHEKRPHHANWTSCSFCITTYNKKKLVPALPHSTTGCDQLSDNLPQESLPSTPESPFSSPTPDLRRRACGHSNRISDHDITACIFSCRISPCQTKLLHRGSIQRHESNHFQLRPCVDPCIVCDREKLKQLPITIPDSDKESILQKVVNLKEGEFVNLINAVTNKKPQLRNAVLENCLKTSLAYRSLDHLEELLSVKLDLTREKIGI